MNSTEKQKGRILMVDPAHYRVEYAINPHMLDAQGRLKEVDVAVARAQWTGLKNIFTELGSEVVVLPPVTGLPDMVFAANQSFPFIAPVSGRKTALISRMMSTKRQPEVAYFEEWYRENGYEVVHLENDKLKFEGNGDAAVHPGQNLIWGGFGFRTDEEVYVEIARRWDFQIIPLRLKLPEFYHLDTCFAILNHETAVVLPEAVEPDGFKQIKKVFKHVIELDHEECLKSFCANCFSPNGHDVILQKGSPLLTEKLEKQGFRVHAVETGEFIKAGGSVFCLKMALPG